MTIFVGFCALAVDIGKMQLVRTELQRTADAAARYAATGLQTSVTEAKNRAVMSGAENTADGRAVVIDSTNDVEFGSWNPDTHLFTVLSGSAQGGATAVRITARRTAARGTAMPTLLAGIVGFRTLDVKASAIATRGQVVAANVDADSCPWLAGASNNTQVAGYDENNTPAVAPAQSPYKVTIPIVPGTKLSFRQAGGQTSYDNGSEGIYGPDGNTSRIVRQRSVNGINATKAPLNAFVGIFLNDNDPDDSSSAAELDFTTPESRDFSTLSPELKQVFFIGDGLDDDGNLQQFTVPAGATRFYLAIMDEKGWWWDNTGSLQTTLLDTKVELVR